MYDVVDWLFFKFYFGRIMVIGDVVYVLIFYYGFGVGFCMEDIVVLGVLFEEFIVC